jgi:hypothetical protein
LGEKAAPHFFSPNLSFWAEKGAGKVAHFGRVSGPFRGDLLGEIVRGFARVLRRFFREEKGFREPVAGIILGPRSFGPGRPTLA